MILKLKFPIAILTNEMQTMYSEEILCSVDRIRVSILFMLTLLLVTNPSFPHDSKYNLYCLSLVFSYLCNKKKLACVINGGLLFLVQEL